MGVGGGSRDGKERENGRLMFPYGLCNVIFVYVG